MNPYLESLLTVALTIVAMAFVIGLYLILTLAVALRRSEQAVAELRREAMGQVQDDAARGSVVSFDELRRRERLGRMFGDGAGV